ncbi:MAG: hypothetical protein LUQ26_05765, partial [Methylococcaceae bacterium]|nr:hypothetical protein [Methylococcaceae bacterium]
GVYAGAIKNISSHLNILDELTKDAARLLKPVLNKPTEQKRLVSNQVNGNRPGRAGRVFTQFICGFFSK